MLARSAQAGQGDWKPVLECFRREYDGEFVAVGLPGEMVEATAGHPFWVVEGAGLADRPAAFVDDDPPSPHLPGRWVEARHLRPGDRLPTREGGTVPVESVALRTDARRIFNLLVDEFRTYVVGTTGVWVHNTSVECELHEVQRRVTSHDVGVQLGRAYATERLGLRETDFVNPFEFHGQFGQGLDDVMEDASGNLWILAYKGGTGTLDEGQMTQQWVEGNIERLLTRSRSNPAGPATPWGLRLLEALEEGRLRGLAIQSTPGPTGTTRELGRWRYTP